MDYVIDAWLERYDPLLRLLDKKTGQEIMRWEGGFLRDMLEQGNLWPDDLSDPDAGLLQQLGLVKEHG